MRYAKTLMALAMVCLLAVPALSMPWKDGRADGDGCPWTDLTDEEMENMTLAELRELRQNQTTQCPMTRCPMAQCQVTQCTIVQCQMTQGRMNQGKMDANFGEFDHHFGAGAFLLMDDLTEEEMANMTIAELKELRQEKIDEFNNMTLAEIEALREQQKAEWENMTAAELKERRQDRNRTFSDHHIFGGMCCFFLMDLSAEELENMTVAELEEMKQEKMDEFNNMTIAEIEALKEQQKAEMENMTIAELKEMGELCAKIGFGGYCMKASACCQYDQRCGMAGCCGCNMKQPMMEQQGRGGDQFGMKGPGSDGCGFRR